MILKSSFTHFFFLSVITKYTFCIPSVSTDGPSGGVCNGRDTVNEIPSSSYPNPKRDESVQDVYGYNVVIKDPYRFLENPDSPETKKFIEDQMAITEPYLEKSPFRAEIRARYRELLDYPRFSAPFQNGNKFFSLQNTGLTNQYVLYIHESFKDDGKVLIDPNTFSKDGTVSLEDGAFSDDGSMLAYATSANGSDWMTIQFRHTERSDIIYEEKLTKVKFTTMAWTRDNKGIFYSGFLDQKGKIDGSENTVNKHHKLYYHVLGTEQSQDVMVVEIPETPDYLIYGTVSDCGKYLIVQVSDGAQNNLIYVVDLNKIKGGINAKLELMPVITKMEKIYQYVTNTENLFIFRTNKNANNYKLITIDIKNPDPYYWIDLVPVKEKEVLELAKVAFEKYMILLYHRDVKAYIRLHEIATGKMVENFPSEIHTGTPAGIYSNKKYKDIFIGFKSFFTPGIVYHCDLSNPSFKFEIIKETKLKNFDRNKFTAEQVFFKSKDGTQVPMYITYKKGLQKNGNNPVFLTAYGGFGDVKIGYFSPFRLLFIDNFDGIHAVANIRGGGEYGEEWHRNGSLDKKQNSFDDFQAAAEFLIAENYTNSKLLAIHGLSNGGLLMGACLNQRPDLFGAVIADVGVMDMLRFDKFTSGTNWRNEYGTPSKPEDFAYLIKYSPLHNIKIPTEADKQYPATMVRTSDHDDRVSPLHSLKFIAELQFQAKSHPNQKNPFIIKVERNTGHGSGKPLDKSIAEYVDMMCFIVLNTGIKFHSSSAGFSIWPPQNTIIFSALILSFSARRLPSFKMLI